MSSIGSCTKPSHARGCPECTRRRNTDPSPDQFEIEDYQGGTEYSYMKVQYKCTSHNGLKIIVFKRLFSLKELLKLKRLDPHFREKDELKIVARFPPTEEGEKMARQIVFPRRTRGSIGPIGRPEGS